VLKITYKNPQTAPTAATSISSGPFADEISLNNIFVCTCEKVTILHQFFKKKMVKENFDGTQDTEVICMMIYQLQKEASIYGITNLLI
jgi:hypothetical protein